jgi:transcriptional regulator with XRE-family HTH domain
VEGERRKEFVKQFGERFSRALKAAGLTRAEAARRMGHPSQNRIVEYAIGYRLPPLDTLAELIERLDLDPAIIFPVWLSQAKRHRKSRVAKGESVHV